MHVICYITIDIFALITNVIWIYKRAKNCGEYFNMILKIVSFTDEGKKIQNLLTQKLGTHIWIPRQKEESLEEWARDGFFKRLPLVFVGAAGIAVRTVAPFVRDKLSDSPVLVIDERGKFVVPILSGHFGGANEIALLIAKKVGALPVITTATDVEKKFAADVFARRNQLKILNRNAIKKVSEKILGGEKLRIWVSPEIKIGGEMKKNPPENVEIALAEENADIVVCCAEKLKIESDSRLFLASKTLCVGAGCKKGKTFEELKNFLLRTFSENHFNIEEIASFSSIDIKKNEMGLLTLAQFFNVPFLTFTAEELKAADGDFSESGFVQKITGVSNVCERAAALASGGGKLLLKKTSADGMTLAVARKIPEIKTW